MMNPGIFVTVSRKWTHPQIFTRITGEEIALSIELDDFLAALKHEIDAQLPVFLDSIRQQVGSVTWVFTQATFDTMFAQAVDKAKATGTLNQIFQDAAKVVIEGIKEESIKVV